MDSNQGEHSYIGRVNDFNKVDCAWLNHRLFGIYGTRAVGKSSFVREYLNRKDAHVLYIDLSTLKDEHSFVAVLCASVHIEPDPNTAISMTRVVEEFNTLSSDVQLVVFFDDAEDFLESQNQDIWFTLCTSITRNCPNVKIFLTSTYKVQFSKLGKVYFSHELKPLLFSDSKCLLESVTRDVDIGAVGDTIAELSEGLPLLILMIGAELSTGEDRLTADQMVTLLLNSRLDLKSRFYSHDESIGALYRRFVLRLNVVSRQHLAALDYIPASFTATEAAYILDCETVALAKQFAIKPIRLRHMLNYEPSSERFNIQGILREVVKANLTIKNLSDVRARYCAAFAAVMKNIAKTMGTVEYTKAMSVFAMEQPNLQKLLSEVNDHPKEETYHFFIEMAASCAELIDIYMAGDGEAFYDGCLELAKRYDKPKDMATVHIARGSIETITKGNLRNGAENYKLALKLLQSSGKSYQLALVYQKMGWNTFKQGYGTKAVEYYRKSLDISEIAGEKYEAMTLQTLSYTGVAQVVLGNFDTAETYHTSCLQKTKRLQGEWHPKVGNVLNNIGLLYEQRGQSAKALRSCY